MARGADSVAGERRAPGALMARLRAAGRLAAVFARLQLLHLQAHLEYEADFLIGVVGNALRLSVGLVFVWALFSQVPHIAGWDLWEVGFLYALVTIPQGLDILVFNGHWSIRRLVNSGQFDRILVRPLPGWLQVLAQDSGVNGLAGIALGAAILWYSSAQLGLAWDICRLAFLVCVLAGSTVLIAAMTFAANCLVFWEPAATATLPDLLVRTTEFAKFPLPAYGGVVRFLLVSVIPVGFISYFPSLVLLGKESDWLVVGMVSPLAGPVAAVVAHFVWSRGLTRYQGVGH